MKLSLFQSLALGLALTVAAPWIASGADDSTKGGRRGQGDRLQATLDKLNLTDDQKAKIKVIKDKDKAERDAFVKEHAEELKAARDSNDQEKMRAVMRPLMEKRMATFEEIKKILTDEQKQKLDEAIAAFGGHGKKNK